MWKGYYTRRTETSLRITRYGIDSPRLTGPESQITNMEQRLTLYPEDLFREKLLGKRTNLTARARGRLQLEFTKMLVSCKLRPNIAGRRHPPISSTFVRSTFRGRRTNRGCTNQTSDRRNASFMVVPDLDPYNLATFVSCCRLWNIAVPDVQHNMRSSNALITIDSPHSGAERK